MLIVVRWCCVVHFLPSSQSISPLQRIHGTWDSTFDWLLCSVKALLPLSAIRQKTPKAQGEFGELSSLEAGDKYLTWVIKTPEHRQTRKSQPPLCPWLHISPFNHRRVFFYALFGGGERFGGAFIKTAIEFPKVRHRNIFWAEKRAETTKWQHHSLPHRQRQFFDESASWGERIGQSFHLKDHQIPEYRPAEEHATSFFMQNASKNSETQSFLPFRGLVDSAIVFSCRNGRWEMSRNPWEDDSGPLPCVRRWRRAITRWRTASDMCGRGGVMAARRHGPMGTYLRSKTPRWWRQRPDGGGWREVDRAAMVVVKINFFVCGGPV